MKSVADVGGRYFAGTRDGLLRYDPVGSRWTRVAFSGKEVTSITPLPESGTLWVTVLPHGADTTTAVAYVSDDGGRAWRAGDGGLSAQAGYHGLAFSLAFDSSDNRRLFLGQSAQIARSIDGGATWSYVYGTASDLGVAIARIAAAPAGTGRVWAGGQDASQRAFVLRSNDRGDSWRILRPTLALDDAVLGLATDPGDDNRLFVGMAGSVRVTDDGGVSWRAVLTTGRAGWVTGLLFVDSLLLALSSEGQGSELPVLGLYSTSDRGLTWDTLPVPASAAGGTSLARGSQHVLLVGTGSGVWRVTSR